MRFTAVLTLICLPLLALSQSDLRPDKQSEAILQLEAGVICAPEAIGSSPAPGTVAGTTHIIDQDPPFVSTARRVPTVLGIGFGVKAMASTPDGLEGVTIVVTHPAMGADNIQTQSYRTRISGLAPSLTFYQFDYDYELLPGIWQMTAMKDDTVLYSTSFEVLPPQKVPELASICGFESLLS